MAKSLDEMLKRLPAERQEKVRLRAQELAFEEMTLRDLRKAHKLTQQDMAAMLKVNQVSISNIESRTDLLLSTLQNYVEKIGGTVSLVATFPGRPPVILRTIKTLSEEAPRRARSRQAS